jgi:hypothetical protein
MRVLSRPSQDFQTASGAMCSAWNTGNNAGVRSPKGARITLVQSVGRINCGNREATRTDHFADAAGYLCDEALACGKHVSAIRLEVTLAGLTRYQPIQRQLDAGCLNSSLQVFRSLPRLVAGLSLEKESANEIRY